MHRNPEVPRGTVTTLWCDSELLQGNPLGDPARRRIDVYLPAGRDGAGLPLLVDLVGFTGGGPSHTNWKNFGENLPERLDRLVASGAMAPAVVALPDCCTKLGGNQYINSAAIGRWDDFLRTEAVALVEHEFSCGGVGRRGVFGKSSGGYGAMVQALLHPDFWAGAASHSGDAGFDLLFAGDFPRALRAIAKTGNNIEQWLKGFFASTETKVKDEDVHVLMVLAMCASYDPDPGAFMGVRLPVTLDTCELIPERWANFLKWDPVNIVDTRGEGLKALKALYVDCGDVDQYNLIYGARRLTAKLTALDVNHVYEEFPDNHSSVDYRMDRSLPILANALR
jgi:hypothetical protein